MRRDPRGLSPVDGPCTLDIRFAETVHERQSPRGAS